MPFPNRSRFALSLTFDVEQCTNFPYWTCVWDHLKHAVDEPTQRYIQHLADAAREHGVKFHWFLLGKSLEAENLDYLRRLVAEGHGIGNHTYRHINVLANEWDQLQVVYRDDPSLRAGCASPLEAIRHELRNTREIIRAKLGVRPRGFRTPGGFRTGLASRPEVQGILRDLGMEFSSSRYHFPIEVDRFPVSAKPSREELRAAMRWSVEHLQPYRWPNGLLEIPMMGCSDIGAFRCLDMDLQEFVALLESGLEFASERGLVYSILLHPQVMAARDPHVRVVRRLLDRAGKLGGWVTTNDALADFLARRGTGVTTPAS